jgi:frataxin-like iron-binding protein CyaY
MSKDLFKWIPNYEGFYMINNQGVIKSVDRFKKCVGENKSLIKGKVLAQSKTSSGYLGVSLSKNGLKKTYRTHQLLAIAFLNHIPCKNKIVVDHKNNIKTDNRLDNLQLITNTENITKTPRGSSKFTGVHFQKQSKRWIATITKKNIQKYIGSFKKELQASEAYNKELLT